MFRRFIGGDKQKREQYTSNESLLLADLLHNGDPFLPGTKSASTDAVKYVTTPILGATDYNYGAVSSGNDIRTNKYGAAFVVLCNVPAQRCIDARMNEVGAANWSIIDRRSDKPVATNDDLSTDNPIARAIIRYQEKYSEPLFARWEQALCIAGENFVQLVRNDYRVAADIEWLNPLNVDIDAPLNVIRGYRYHGEGVFETLRPQEVAYDREPSNLFTDIYGHSPLMSAVPDANIIINSGRTLAAYFRNDARPGAIIRPKTDSFKNSLNEHEVALLEKLFLNHKGAGNASKWLMLNVPVDVETFDQPDLQKWAELIKTLETEIYTAFGVPRSIAGDSDSQRYQASPQDEPHFKRLIARRLSRIQDAFNTSITPFFDPSGNYRLEFDLSDYEVIPPETVTTANSMLLSAGISFNEYRKMVGEDELPGGDFYYVPSGVVIVKQADLIAGVVQPGQPAPETPALQPLVNDPIPETPDPTKDAGEPLFVGLSLANDPNLIGLQRRLTEVYPEGTVRWNTPSEYHVTVLYAEATDEASAKAFCEALKELPLPDLSLRIGQLNSFDNLGEHAVHLRIRQNSALKEYQAAVYDLAEEYGIVCSPYSNPAQWTPHITMCYLPEKVGRTTFGSKLTVTPKGVMCDYGGSPLWHSWETDDTEPPDDEPAKDEFKAWLKYQKNNAGKANKRPFAFEYVSSDIADTVVKCIALGESAESVYNRLAHVVAGDMPAELPEVTTDYQATLLNFGLTDIHNAVKAHAHGVLLAKALTDTRSRFESALTAQMKQAQAEKIKKPVFVRRVLITLTRYARLAMADGFTDGGIEDFNLDDTDDESAVDASVWLDNFIDQQEQYVQNVADVLYTDDKLDDSEIEGKSELWFTHSVMPAYNHGLAQASGDNALGIFKLGETEQHCIDCAALDGKAVTFKKWLKYFDGELPPSSKTQCGGWRCKCKIEPYRGKKFRGNLPPLHPKA